MVCVKLACSWIAIYVHTDYKKYLFTVRFHSSMAIVHNMVAWMTLRRSCASCKKNNSAVKPAALNTPRWMQKVFIAGRCAVYGGGTIFAYFSMKAC